MIDRCLMSLSKRPHLGLGWEVFFLAGGIFVLTLPDTL